MQMPCISHRELETLGMLISSGGILKPTPRALKGGFFIRSLIHSFIQSFNHSQSLARCTSLTETRNMTHTNASALRAKETGQLVENADAVGCRTNRLSGDVSCHPERDTDTVLW